MKRIAGIMVVFSVSVLFISRCFAVQTAHSNFLALKGIKSVFVLVEDLPRGVTEMGLTAEMIKNEAESKLKREGLSVPTFSYGDPYLYLSLRVVGEAFSIEVSLRDYVILKRDRKITCAAATWVENVTGVHHGDGSLFIEGLQEALDAFLTDYHKANPEKKPK
jgi:hypothetical protein